MVGDHVVEAGRIDLIGRVEGDVILHAGHRDVHAVAGDRDGVGDAADTHVAVVARDRLALADAGDADLPTRRRGGHRVRRPAAAWSRRLDARNAREGSGWRCRGHWGIHASTCSR